jgi:tripartite-type tricarboxylate transporter receptor subunit TctC
MIELRQGSIVLTLPAELSELEKAGKLDPTAVSRISRTPKGLGQACFHTADSMEKAGSKFTPPADITPEVLRAAGQKAEKIDQVIQDLQVLTNWAKQASLLYKAEAYTKLRKVNDYVKAQGKHNRECYSLFGLLRAFFKRLGRGPAPAIIEVPASSPTNDKPSN